MGDYVDYGYERDSYRYSISSCLFFCIFLPSFFVGMHLALSCRILCFSLKFEFTVSLIHKIAIVLISTLFIASRFMKLMRLLCSLLLLLSAYVCGFSFFLIVKGVCEFGTFAQTLSPFVVTAAFTFFLSRSFSYPAKGYESMKKYISDNAVQVAFDLIVFVIFVIYIYYC